jgi:large subunit ribosomal protein L25
MSQDTITLEVTARDVSGKAVKHLRKNGIVPAVIHDHGKDSIMVQASYLDLLRAYQAAGKHHPIELKAPEQSYTVLIKDAVFEPRKNQLTHLVFNAVDKNQKVEAEIPIQPKYDEENDSSPAERAGLIVLAQLEAVQVRAIASKLPDVLYYDAEKLVEVGDHLTVADLTAPEGVEFITDENHAIASVFEPSALAAANDAAGGDATEEEATGDADAGDSAEGLDAERAAEAGETGEGETKPEGE